jgi:hypothetical protein
VDLLRAFTPRIDQNVFHVLHGQIMLGDMLDVTVGIVFGIPNNAGE